jgi:predicted TIM-barrel fold metal-dependent hydrolase
VKSAVERARRVLAGYDEELRREIPEGTEILDAHVHLGEDIDGFRGVYEELLAFLDAYGIARCFVFCLDEPDRHPAFRAPNDRTLEHARRADGRLIPFARLDLNEGPIEEAERCLELGARGIKLHPRAQRFDFADERLRPIFELAGERRVPILIHGGRGLPPIADQLARHLDASPGAQLIIAHAGIADLGALAERFAGRAGVFFDTSVWSAVDLLDLFRLVPPEQIVYGSDYPYGQQPGSLLIAVRTAKASGLDEAQVHALLAGNAARIAAGEAPVEPTSPVGPETLSQPLVLARIHQYLSTATGLLWLRQSDTIGLVGLALNACGERNGAVPELERIRELLAAARDLWTAAGEVEDEAEARQLTRTTFRLIHLADIWAVTTRARA